MKLKALKQRLSELETQLESGETVDLSQLAELKSILHDKKTVCKHKLRHRVNFAKRERIEKKLKKVKKYLRRLKRLEETAA